MEITTLIQYGTPVILLGLIISNVRLTAMVNNLQESIRNMQKKVVWSDTYNVMREGVDGRLDRLETQMNGK